MSRFCICKSYSHFFSKNTCEFGIVLTRTVNILTTNELLKLTTLWTTGPWFYVKTGYCSTMGWRREHCCTLQSMNRPNSLFIYLTCLCFHQIPPFRLYIIGNSKIHTACKELWSTTEPWIYMLYSKPQWLKHLWDHGNLFETLVVQANEG